MHTLEPVCVYTLYKKTLLLINVTIDFLLYISIRIVHSLPYLDSDTERHNSGLSSRKTGNLAQSATSNFSKTCFEDAVLCPETMHLFFSMIICKVTQADFIPADFGSDENQGYN